MLQVADISNHTLYSVLQTGDLKKAGIRRRSQGIARNLCPGKSQDAGKPGAFKTRVSGDQNFFISIKFL